MLSYFIEFRLLFLIKHVTNLPNGGFHFSIRGFNIPWMKIDPGVNIPYDTGTDTGNNDK
jgi:hypothetical protein